MKVLYRKRTDVLIVSHKGREFYLVREGFGDDLEVDRAYEFNELIPESVDSNDPIIVEVVAELEGKAIPQNGVPRKKRGRRSKAEILAEMQMVN